MGKSARAARRQQIELDGDEPDEEQTHPVSGHGRCRKDDAAHDAVKPAVFIDGRKKADGEAQHDHIDQGKARK